MRNVAALIFCALAAIIAGGAARADEPCNPVGKLGFICGPLNAEDLVPVPGTGWIVAGGMDGGGAGGHGALHLIDSRDKSWKMLFSGGAAQTQPDKAAYADCPGPPDWNKFSAHGLNLRPGQNGRHTLYVVNHGGREAVEIFTLDAADGEPKATWIGCAVMPDHTWPNSVAPLPDGGFVVTNMFDPKDSGSAAKLAGGEVTGAVYEWQPHQGFKKVPGSEFSGDNGIEVSPDGNWLYVAAWGNKAVVRLPRQGGASERIAAGFLVDNLRRAPDGMLIVAGQDVPAKDVFGCFESAARRCTQAWRAVRWDTQAMRLTPVAAEAGNPDFGDATVGLQVGDTLYVGTFRGDRIAYLTLK
jgi:hypothetical protein